jgi:hypothetical protein
MSIGNGNIPLKIRADVAEQATTGRASGMPTAPRLRRCRTLTVRIRAQDATQTPSGSVAIPENSPHFAELTFYIQWIFSSFCHFTQTP